MISRTQLAAAVISVVVSSAAHAQEEGPETLERVGQEFVGVLKQNGWKDARYASIRGDGALFEIQGVKGSRRSADGSAETLEVGRLTIEAIDPGDRWVRAESVRIDGLRALVGGEKVEIGTIYAKKPGLLDVDLGRPAAAFDNAVLTDVSWSRGGRLLVALSQVYLSGDRWIGEFGIPGRLDVAAKGTVSAGVLPFLPQPLAGASLTGDFSFKTSVASMRDELTLASAFSDGAGSWAASAVFTEFDTGLFRAWFDKENFNEDRSAETSRTYAEAFERELADIGLKSFEFAAKGDGSARGPVLDALAQALPALLPTAFLDAAAAFSAFVKDPKSFTVSGYARDGVPVATILDDGGAAFSGFSIKTGR